MFMSLAFGVGVVGVIPLQITFMQARWREPILDGQYLVTLSDYRVAWFLIYISLYLYHVYESSVWGVGEAVG